VPTVVITPDIATLYLKKEDRLVRNHNKINFCVPLHAMGLQPERMKYDPVLGERLKSAEHIELGRAYSVRCHRM